MSRPALVAPIGLRLTRTAHGASQAFERAMAEAGGSAAAFQVLLLVRAQEWGTQAEMAAAMGITPATLTHHLNQLDRQGLVRRWREDGNRRSQRVALTTPGEAELARLRTVAIAHDERLRSALSDGEADQLAALLDKLAAALERDA